MLKRGGDGRKEIGRGEERRGGRLGQGKFYILYSLGDTGKKLIDVPKRRNNIRLSKKM